MSVVLELCDQYSFLSYERTGRVTICLSVWPLTWPTDMDDGSCEQTNSIGKMEECDNFYVRSFKSIAVDIIPSAPSNGALRIVWGTRGCLHSDNENREQIINNQSH